MTYDEIRERYASLGSAMLPQEEYATIPLGTAELPQTWELVNLGLVRIDQFTGGDHPSVRVQVKLLNLDPNSRTSDREGLENAAASKQIPPSGNKR